MNNYKPTNKILDTFSLTGKVALVTGAGKGIGRACAYLLADAGAKVIAVARTESDLQSLSQKYGTQIETWTEDTTSDQFLERLAQLDKLDVLVNNVGTNKPELMVDVEAETLDRVLSINVRAAFMVAQGAARIMLNQGSGSIIHMSSQMGHIGAKNRTVYCMTKHAIEGLSKAMAVEMAPDGVRVNCVAPTFIETTLTKPMFEDEEFKRQALGHIPMNKIGQVEDVAAAVLYLASDASKMVTGDSLKVDGGWTAH